MQSARSVPKRLLTSFHNNLREKNFRACGRNAEIPPNATAEAHSDPGAVFKELWAINGPFESAYMSAYNRDVWGNFQDSPSDGGSS